MRLIAASLAIAALASGCSKDKPKDPPVAKPAEPPAAADTCGDRHAVIDSMFRVQSRVELVCDAGGARVRFMDEEITDGKTAERVLTAAEWDAAWKAIDATKWSTLPEACGEAADDEEGPRYEESHGIEITAGGTTKRLSCAGTEIPATHVALIDALTAPASSWIDAAEQADAQAARTSPWQIEVGHAGPVRGGMPLDELRALPDVTLKTVTVEVAIELEGEDEMGTEEQEQIQVWSGGEHQLTIAYAGYVKDDLKGSEDRIIGIEVVGRLPRVAPIADEWPAGVGTTAQELQDRYGAPSEYDPEDPWAPGACALFEKQPAATFCFDTKAKSFEQVRKKNLPVTALEVRL